nr:hypothetical protein Itr_chr05CG11920 [Ipomoea trifida]
MLSRRFLPKLRLSRQRNLQRRFPRRRHSLHQSSKVPVAIPANVPAITRADDPAKEMIEEVPIAQPIEEVTRMDSIQLLMLMKLILIMLPLLCWLLRHRSVSNQKPRAKK